MKENKNRLIVDSIIIVIMLVCFLIFNGIVRQSGKRRFYLMDDGTQYCYGINSFERKGDLLTLKGWFLELESVQKVPRTISSHDADLLIGLIPLSEAISGEKLENVPIMSIEKCHDERPDVNRYFLCEFDYSRSGFVATLDCDDIDLSTTCYRIAIKLDDRISKKAILTNLYLTNKGLCYTDPSQSPELDTLGTDLDYIVNEGVRVVSRPDFGCYVYQLEDRLYWIADETYSFCEDGATYIQYQMETTQYDKLPADRLENNWFWSNIGDYFENHEITNQMNCGKYRVSVRDIPKEYSVTHIQTGYHNGDWVWCSEFKPVYSMLIR